MRVSTNELRTHTQELFDCLERGETVTLTYRGKDKGIISGIRESRQSEYNEFPVFGIWADRKLDVDAYIMQLHGVGSGDAQ